MYAIAIVAGLMLVGIAVRQVSWPCLFLYITARGIAVQVPDFALESVLIGGLYIAVSMRARWRERRAGSTYLKEVEDYAAERLSKLRSHGD